MYVFVCCSSMCGRHQRRLFVTLTHVITTLLFLLVFSTDAQHIYTQLDHGLSVCLSQYICLCLYGWFIRTMHSQLNCLATIVTKPSVHTDDVYTCNSVVHSINPRLQCNESYSSAISLTSQVKVIRETNPSWMTGDHTQRFNFGLP